MVTKDNTTSTNRSYRTREIIYQASVIGRVTTPVTDLSSLSNKHVQIMAYIREGVNAQICRASITYIPNVEKTGSTDPRGKGSATYCKTAPMNWTAEQARLPPGSKNTARFIGPVQQYTWNLGLFPGLLSNQIEFSVDFSQVHVRVLCNTARTSK